MIYILLFQDNEIQFGLGGGGAVALSCRLRPDALLVGESVVVAWLVGDLDAAYRARLAASSSA